MEYLVPLKDIQTEGREAVVDDPAAWESLWRTYGVDIRAGETPVKAECSLMSQEEGVLVRGRITGEVVAPCDRCTADARIVLDQTFDEFEPLPEEDEGRQGREARAEAEPDLDAQDALIRWTKGGWMFDVGALVWQQFALAMPVKPLCKRECKGLCAQCGEDLNTGSCTCEKQNLDPRLAALRGLKVAKK